MWFNKFAFILNDMLDESLSQINKLLPCLFSSAAKLQQFYSKTKIHFMIYKSSVLLCEWELFLIFDLKVIEKNFEIVLGGEAGVNQEAFDAGPFS